MRSILRKAFVSLLFTGAVGVVIAGNSIGATEPESALEKAKRNLKHAYTYHWLARARGSSVFELKKARDYALKAQEQLLLAKPTSESDETWDALRREAKGHIDYWQNDVGDIRQNGRVYSGNALGYLQ